MYIRAIDIFQNKYNMNMIVMVVIDPDDNKTNMM